MYRLWRIAATGMFFALLFGGGAILALTAFPVIHLTTRSPEKRRTRNQLAIHKAFRIYIALLQALQLIDLKIVGAEKLNGAGGRMIVANHPSLLDVVLLMALVRRSQCIVKSELWESGTLGRLVRGAGYIRNDLEPEAMLAACRNSLDSGETLLIFPEGTRSVPGEPVIFRRGFANIATLLGAEIQTVVITCNPPTLTKGEKWWSVPVSKPLFVADVGELIKTADWIGTEPRSIASRRLTRHVNNLFAVRLSDARPGTGN
jgi:1-acyl-sn-glycerol-3-phosphate acyltransferase